MSGCVANHKLKETSDQVFRIPSFNLNDPPSGHILRLSKVTYSRASID